MSDITMHDVDDETVDDENEAFIEYDHLRAVEGGVQRCNEVWDNFLAYARTVEKRSDDYVKRISKDTDSEGALEKVKGLADWVRRTKGSYESKLFEMEAMLDHVSDGQADGYLGYDVKLHPDVSIMNWNSGKHTAIEMKQVESMDPNRVHPNLYAAIKQLTKRNNYSPSAPYTHWKAYIYVNPGNPWPFPLAEAQKGYDLASYKEQMKTREALQTKTKTWKAWVKARGNAPLTVVIKHGDYGRYDYVLGG